uniref:Hydroxyproline-rich glycopeptide II n=1 Tax=Petunia hybrida TaxID=4102 RepID=A5JP05_PETHY|nr:hydroxyproline-rich glycopeptide precursor II [Petunia x hybrida]
MRALFLICILSSFGAEARTLLEKHHQYGKPAHPHDAPPSPSSSPPSSDLSNVSPTPTDENVSENDELSLMTIISADQEENIINDQRPLLPTYSSDNRAIYKKLFVTYLLPVSYVWNHVTLSSFNYDDSSDKTYDERYGKSSHISPPSPKPSDHEGNKIINSINFHDHTPPAPKHNPPSPVLRITSKGTGGQRLVPQISLSNPFIAST